MHVSRSKQQSATTATTGGLKDLQASTDLCIQHDIGSAPGYWMTSCYIESRALTEAMVELLKHAGADSAMPGRLDRCWNRQLTCFQVHFFRNELCSNFHQVHSKGRCPKVSIILPHQQPKACCWSYDTQQQWHQHNICLEKRGRRAGAILLNKWA